MRDWYVDGHFISADDEQEARSEVLRLYDHHAEVVRPWTDEDQED